MPCPPSAETDDYQFYSGLERLIYTGSSQQHPGRTEYFVPSVLPLPPPAGAPGRIIYPGADCAVSRDPFCSYSTVRHLVNKSGISASTLVVSLRRTVASVKFILCYPYLPKSKTENVNILIQNNRPQQIKSNFPRTVVLFIFIEIFSLIRQNQFTNGLLYCMLNLFIYKN